MSRLFRSKRKYTQLKNINQNKRKTAISNKKKKTKKKKK